MLKAGRVAFKATGWAFSMTENARSKSWPRDQGPRPRGPAPWALGWRSCRSRDAPSLGSSSCRSVQFSGSTSMGFRRTRRVSCPLGVMVPGVIRREARGVGRTQGSGHVGGLGDQRRVRRPARRPTSIRAFVHAAGGRHGHHDGPSAEPTSVPLFMSTSPRRGRTTRGTPRANRSMREVRPRTRIFGEPWRLRGLERALVAYLAWLLAVQAFGVDTDSACRIHDNPRRLLSRWPFPEAMSAARRGSTIRRRRRDSNPWYSCPYGGFQNRCLRPLGHSSEDENNVNSCPVWCLASTRVQLFPQGWAKAGGPSSRTASLLVSRPRTSLPFPVAAPPAPADS